LAVFLGLGLIILPEAGLAAEEAASSGYLAGYENPNPQPTAISWWSTLAYLVSLVAVFAFVVVLAYFAARFLGGKFNSQQGRNGGRVLEYLPLGTNRSVCVVEVAGRVVMLGVTDQSITLLTEITDPDEIERLERKSLTGGFTDDRFNNQFGALSDIVSRIPPIFKK